MKVRVCPDLSNKYIGKKVKLRLTFSCELNYSQEQWELELLPHEPYSQPKGTQSNKILERI
ncbi:hypothetical protein C7459_11485 [Tumebacillus permanentifrigoris]|uniref:Uncharacterized protein n=1 Tax=Tumebacillus permanentifrigoris TaxID=378543 RepID=A0A316DA43_9BACL|nr:hypothetical protein C7459_11485 [Tumebacillus permanentifrigoris]